MNRWKAAGIHLLISFLVVGSVAAYIIYFWYPPALIHMAKADRLLALIAGVDLVVGPLLTLIVYKVGKRHLKLDLSIIALIQISFLGYGLYSTYVSRPVFLVAVADRFELVFANEISEQRLAEARLPQVKTLGFTKPVLVGASLPSSSSPNERRDVLFSSLSGFGDVQNMPKYYVDYSQMIPSLKKRGKKLEKQTGLSEAHLSSLRASAESYDKNPDDLLFLPLASSRNFAVMLIDAKTGGVVGPVNIDP